MHLAHEVVGTEHLADRKGEREGYAHGQPFGYGHDDQRHGDHEVVEDTPSGVETDPRAGREGIDAEEQADGGDGGENENTEHEPEHPAEFFDGGGQLFRFAGEIKGVVNDRHPYFDERDGGSGEHGSEQADLAEGEVVLPVEYVFEEQGEEGHEGQGEADHSDQFGEAVELTVQGGNLFGFDGSLTGHFAEFGGVADADHARDAVAVDNGGAAQHMIAGIGGVFFELFGMYGLRGRGFAGEVGFVDLQRHGFEQFGVGGHFVAGFEQNDVAHDDLFLADFAHLSVADDAHGTVVVHLVEDVEFPGGIDFKPKGDAGSQENGAEDADGLVVFAVHE